MKLKRPTIPRPKIAGRPAAWAGFIGVQVVALAAVAWGWRFSHSWPTTPGVHAVAAVAVVQTAAVVALAPALLRRWGDVGLTAGTAALTLAAAAAVEPAPHRLLPWAAAGHVAAWAVALHLLVRGRRWPRLRRVVWLLTLLMLPASLVLTDTTSLLPLHAAAAARDPAAGLSHFPPPAALPALILGLCGLSRRARPDR